MKPKARRWKVVALLAAGIAVGVAMTATPATSHVGGTVAHLWNHLKPLADARYANAVAGTDKAKNADKLDGFNSTALFKKVTFRFSDVTTGNSQNGSTAANCEAGEQAVGGGSELRSGTITNFWFFGDEPVVNADGVPTGWHDSVWNASGQSNTWRVYVLCAS